MRQAVGQHVRGKLADSKLAYLLPPTRKFVTEPTLVADPDEPMLLESLNAHALAIVDDNNGGVLVVQIRGKNNLDSLGAGVEGVRDELFNSLVRAGVQAFRKQFDNSVAEADINLVRRVANRHKAWFVRHCRVRLPVRPESLDSIVHYQNVCDGTNEFWFSRNTRDAI